MKERLMTSWYRDYDSNGAFAGNGNAANHELRKNPASRRPILRFDFEIGYLMKSPCRTCDKRDAFPGCDETCDLLDKIHSMLCDNVSCTRHG